MPSRIGIFFSRNVRIREERLQLLLDLLRAAADGLHRAAAVLTARMRGPRVAAVVAHQAAAGGMIRQVDAAPRTLRHIAAVHADQIPAVAAAVQEQDGLLAVQNGVADALLQLAADIEVISRPQLLLHVNDARIGKRAAVIPGLEGIKGINPRFCQIHRLDRRCRGAKENERPLLRAAVERDFPCVVTRGIFGFIGMLLLLIEDDDGRISYRREHGRACADRDARVAARNAPPLVAALAHAQA